MSSFYSVTAFCRGEKIHFPWRSLHLVIGITVSSGIYQLLFQPWPCGTVLASTPAFAKQCQSNVWNHCWGQWFTAQMYSLYWKHWGTVLVSKYRKWGNGTHTVKWHFRLIRVAFISRVTACGLVSHVNRFLIFLISSLSRRSGRVRKEHHRETDEDTSCQRLQCRVSMIWVESPK